MKPLNISRSFAFLVVVVHLTGSPTANAQTDDTAWTSVDGTTIWASLEGIVGDQVVLHMRGRTFCVPKSRLAPKSIEKLGRMLELSPQKSQLNDRSTSSVERGVAHDGGKVAVSDRRSESGGQGLSPTPSKGSVGGPARLDFTSPLPPSIAVTDSSSAVRSPCDTRGSGQAPALELNPISEIRLEGRRAIALSGLPSTIHTAIEAGNDLQTKSYKWGGGRAKLEGSGYDCSGAVSYVLIKAGLLQSQLSSLGFSGYGSPGQGRWITIYARKGHVFMTICGLRLDTGDSIISAGRERGPRWRPEERSASGYVTRHPPEF